MSSEDQCSQFIFETEEYNNELRVQFSGGSSLDCFDTTALSANRNHDIVTTNVLVTPVTNETVVSSQLNVRKQYRLLKKSPSKSSSPSKLLPIGSRKSFRNRLRNKQNSPKKLKCIQPKLLPNKGLKHRILRAKPPTEPIIIPTVLPENERTFPSIQPKPEISREPPDGSVGHDQIPSEIELASSTLAQQQQEEHLMAFLKASSTIEKSSDRRNKKKQRLHKQQKKLQDKIKALSFVSDLKSQEEVLVVSYLMKVHRALASMGGNKFEEFITCFTEFSSSQDPVEKLYFKICKLLSGFDELKEELVMFLTPQQAVSVGKYPEYCSFVLMREFIGELKFHSTKQHQHLQKVVKAIQSMVSRADLTHNDFLNQIKPLLQFQPVLVDSFAQIFQSSQPVKSLPEDFEEIQLTDQEPEEVEVFTLHETAGDVKQLVENCACSCHESANQNQPSKFDHCVSCGLRFLDGRVHFQFGKTIRPVKVCYVVDKNEEALTTNVDSKSKSATTSKGAKRSDISAPNKTTTAKQRKPKEKSLVTDEEKPKKGRANKRKIDKISK